MAHKDIESSKNVDSQVFVKASSKLRQAVLDEFNLALTDVALEGIRDDFIRKNQLGALKFLDGFLEDLDKLPTKALDAQGTLNAIAPDMVNYFLIGSISKRIFS